MGFQLGMTPVEHGTLQIYLKKLQPTKNAKLTQQNRIENDIQVYCTPSIGISCLTMPLLSVTSGTLYSNASAVCLSVRPSVCFFYNS